MVARVRYTVGSTTFTREAFASYPDHVIVLRVSADRPRSVAFTVRVTTPHPDTAVAVARGRLTVGATAGVAEMLVQSQTGVIQVLPALPSAWPAGTVDGLRVRGAAPVGVTWRAGRATEIRIASDHGGALRVQDRMLSAFRLIDADRGHSVAWTRESADTIRFQARAGGAYRILLLGG